MPEMDGLEATRAICADDELAGVKILVVTTFETDDYLVEALRAGASGFVGKGVETRGAAGRDPHGRSRRCAPVGPARPGA